MVCPSAPIRATSRYRERMPRWVGGAAVSARRFWARAVHFRKPTIFRQSTPKLRRKIVGLRKGSDPHALALIGDDRDHVKFILDALGQRSRGFGLAVIDEDLRGQR